MICRKNGKSSRIKIPSTTDDNLKHHFKDAQLYCCAFLRLGPFYPFEFCHSEGTDESALLCTRQSLLGTTQSMYSG